MDSITGFDRFIGYLSVYLRDAPDFLLDVDSGIFTLTFFNREDFEHFCRNLSIIKDSSIDWSDNSDIVDDEDEEGIASAWTIDVWKVVA